MKEFQTPAYVAILRTRDAELKGFRNLDASTRRSMLPVMEFTRSRRGKNNPDAAVAVCVDQVREILGDGPFVADVSTLAALGSSETHALLDPSRNFLNWRRFVSSLGSSCIPIVHLTDPLDPAGVQAQAASLVENSGLVAIRIPPSYPNVALLEQALVAALGSLKKVVLICDAEFVDRGSYSNKALAAYRTLFSFGDRPLCSVVASSCFPSSVVPNYGSDSYGKFHLLEVAMSKWIKEQDGTAHVLHGDYALIYPEDVVGTVTRWVPRVDVPLDEQVFYHRYRRGDGGYVKAASEAFKDSDYSSLPCWGHDNIVEAAKGAPMGRSPAHWIAARVNYHISRQVARLTYRTR